jgi:hypothetical protein
LNCEIKLENGTIINSHDDGEVSINFPIDQVDENLVDRIFENNNLDRSLIAKLKSRPGHYIAIDKNSNIIGDFKNFDDYVKNRNL